MILVRGACHHGKISRSKIDSKASDKNKKEKGRGRKIGEKRGETWRRRLYMGGRWSSVVSVHLRVFRVKDRSRTNRMERREEERRERKKERKKKRNGSGYFAIAYSGIKIVRRKPMKVVPSMSTSCRPLSSLILIAVVEGTVKLVFLSPTSFSSFFSSLILVYSRSPSFSLSFFLPFPLSPFLSHAYV